MEVGIFLLIRRKSIAFRELKKAMKEALPLTTALTHRFPGRSVAPALPAVAVPLGMLVGAGFPLPPALVVGAAVLLAAPGRHWL